MKTDFVAHRTFNTGLVHGCKQVSDDRVVACLVDAPVFFGKFAKCLLIVDHFVGRVGLLSVRLLQDPVHVFVKCIEEEQNTFLTVLLAKSSKRRYIFAGPFLYIDKCDKASSFVK